MRIRFLPLIAAALGAALLLTPTPASAQQTEAQSLDAKAMMARVKAGKDYPDFRNPARTFETFIWSMLAPDSRVRLSCFTDEAKTKVLKGKDADEKFHDHLDKQMKKASFVFRIELVGITWNEGVALVEAVGYYERQGFIGRDRIKATVENTDDGWKISNYETIPGKRAPVKGVLDQAKPIQIN